MKFIVSVFTTCVLLVLWSILFFPQNAYAYLDPGTGSYILQMLIAAIVGGLFVIKIYFHKIKAFFKGVFFKEDNDGSFKGE